MSEFYFKIVASNRVKYVCIERVEQKAADSAIGVYSGEGQLERIEKKDLPSNIKFTHTVKNFVAWESDWS
jgi:hypothetical protein